MFYVNLRFISTKIQENCDACVDSLYQAILLLWCSLEARLVHSQLMIILRPQRRYDTGTSMIQLSYIILWHSDKILVLTRVLIRSWGARVVPPLLRPSNEGLIDTVNHMHVTFNIYMIYSSKFLCITWHATVDREIFAVKIFSLLAVATKIWHAMLYQLHGWASDENYLTDENFLMYGML